MRPRRLKPPLPPRPSWWLEEARAHFDTATQIAPRLVDAFINLASVLIDQSRTAAARAALDRALALDRTNAQALVAMGVLRLRTGDGTERLWKRTVAD